MQPAALVRSDHAWLPARATAHSAPLRSSAGIVTPLGNARVDGPAPSRVGGAPLTGLLGVDAYRGTAQALQGDLVGRIDEYV